MDKNVIAVAVLDTGIFRHRDFDDRIVAFKDFVQGKNVVYDDNGHGTHVAGIIAGSGASSNRKYAGIAPKVRIVSLKVLDKSGNGRVCDVLDGVDWLIRNAERFNVRVVNVSFGSVQSLAKSSEENYMMLEKAAEKMWDSGLVVVCAAGNNGPKAGSVTIPGACRKIITVGAFDGKRFYSGRGPTQECIAKPEILVSGSDIVSCSNVQGRYAVKSGTSMAAPIVSGAVARLLSANPYLSAGEVKLRLHDCAHKRESYNYSSAWGILDVEKFVKMLT